MQVNLDDFDVSEKDGLKLITPKRVTAVSNSAWTHENLWLRSRIEDASGNTVSQSFGKFFNLGMGPEDLKTNVSDIVDAIEKQDAYATLKLDGSALIRSVYKDKVYLRTRGSFTYSHLDNAWEVDELFRVKYPCLFDPNWGKGISLIFEWTSPNNVIVIKYPHPELTLVGGIEHLELNYIPLDVLKMTVELIGCPMVPYFPLDMQGWAKLNEEMATNKYIEGYVIRIHDEQTLVKVKCESYLIKHRLKSNMSTENLIDMWLDLGMPTFKEFVAYFETTYDEEIAMWALPVVSAMMDGVKKLQGITEHIQTKVDDARKLNLTNKEFAISMQSQYGVTKKFYLAMALWREYQNNSKLIKGILLQNTKQMEKGMFTKDEVEDEQ